ncbi:MAG: glycosyltransferase family 2 protein [Bdellovibrionales bacterium]|nr:glycosyltransferase family 2 protein [Bdellovibrionales bacterium]
MSVLSLVLPCHNEQEAIPVVLDKLLRDRPRIIEEAGLTDLEIIVVDDGSTDSSAKMLKKLEPQIRFIRLEKNQGYGRALKTGFSAARGQLLGFYDLDDTCQPEDLIPMIHTLNDEEAGMVCGNRLNQDTKMPPQRYLGNWLYRSLTRILLRHEVQDCCTGMRIFSARYRDEFSQTLPDDLNFSLAMTIRFLKGGGTYREVPIQYHRRLGESKLSIYTDGPLFLWTLLRYSFQ